MFWIPVIPFYKRFFTECLHCKQVKFQKEYNSSEVQHIKRSHDRKIPIGYYFGLLAIIALIITISITLVNDQKVKENYLKNPEVGDIYEVKVKEGSSTLYTLYRIVNVRADSVTFEVNDYAVDKMRGLRDLKKNNSSDYSEIVTLAQSEIHQLNADGNVLSISKASDQDK